MRKRDVLAVQKGPVSRKLLICPALLRRINNVCKCKMPDFDKILYSPSRSDILTNKYFEGYKTRHFLRSPTFFAVMQKFGNSPQRHRAAWPEAEIFTMSKHHSYHKRSKDSGRGAKGSRLKCSICDAWLLLSFQDHGQRSDVSRMPCVLETRPRNAQRFASR
jgi:hypothetical protein